MVKQHKTTREHGHSDEEIAKRIAKVNETSLLKDFVYGAIDGTVTTFAIISGVAGAGLSQGVIIALGLANVLADGFSMAASNYLGTRSELQNHRRITETENRHISNFRAGEITELKAILSHHGLSGTDLNSATDIITRCKPLWINLMLAGEYGLSPVEPRPLAASIATFIAFVACGLLPLLPFLLNSDSAYIIAAGITAMTFLIIGAMRSRWSTQSWWLSALQTLLIGGCAATIAYVAGALVSA